MVKWEEPVPHPEPLRPNEILDLADPRNELIATASDPRVSYALRQLAKSVLAVADDSQSLQESIREHWTRTNAKICLVSETMATGLGGLSAYCLIEGAYVSGSLVGSAAAGVGGIALAAIRQSKRDN